MGSRPLIFRAQITRQAFPFILLMNFQSVLPQGFLEGYSTWSSLAEVTLLRSPRLVTCCALLRLGFANSLKPSSVQNALLLPNFFNLQLV